MNGIRLGLMVGLAGIAALACVGFSDGASPAGLSCPNCPLLPVERVIDGDTFMSEGVGIRLYGVNTPERGEQCFTEATDRLRELAEGGVRVEPGPRAEDYWGRRLAYVYTEEGASVDEALIREGLAWAWTRDGQHRDALIALEGEAQRQGVGCLW